MFSVLDKWLNGAILRATPSGYKISYQGNLYPVTENDLNGILSHPGCKKLPGGKSWVCLKAYRA